MTKGNSDPRGDKPNKTHRESRKSESGKLKDHKAGGSGSRAKKEAKRRSSIEDLKEQAELTASEKALLSINNTEKAIL